MTMSPGLEGGNQLLFDVGAKAYAVDRTVEDTGRCQPVASQGTEECQGAPVAVRRKCPQTLSLWSPASDRRHVGLDPGFVDEDETFRIEMLLQALPPLSPAGDVGASLFKGQQRFFLKRRPSLRMNSQIVL